MASVNKNFVVKNGLEVNDNLILANASTKRVGIGSTVPDYTLDVAGGIGATHIYAAGISTFADDVELLSDLRVGTGGTVFSILSVGSSIGIGTNLPKYLVDIRSSVSTGQTALYTYGDLQVSGDINVTDIFFNDAVGEKLYISGIGTVITLKVTDGTITDLDSTNIRTTNLSGTISTITNLTGTIATVTNLSGTIGTITTINSTSGSFSNLSGTIGTITSLEVTNISSLSNLTAIASTITNLSGTIATITEIDSTNINVSDTSILGSVKISSGIITSSSSGIVTYYGDGGYLQNISAEGTIGLNSGGSSIGVGATIIDFFGSAIENVTVSGGIGTVTIINTDTIGVGIGSTLGYVGSGVTLINFRGTGVSTVTSISAGITTVFFQGGSESVGAAGTWDTTPVGIHTTKNVGIATTTARSGVALYVDGHATFVGVVTATDFNSTSDIYLKENINTVDNALDTIKKLRGVSFDWKKDHKPSYGVIAQELEEILPALVSDTIPKTVNYNGIIGVLIEAIKELSEKIEKIE